ncbi:MAG TPA: FAD-binding oxidoreductase [Methylomirabilota bacterium]|jgi:glycolate oxidase FAD binding subunit|nr:FAD-binding oxidoreductase [Methylomirabilota bacterium]
MTQISHAEEQDINTRGKTEGKERFTIDGRTPQDVIVAETVEHVAESLRLANAQRRAVAPIGLGAFLHLGAAPRRYDVALSLRRLNRVVDYQPTDMTVTVEAGLSLARLQQVLGEHGQWLSIDPPLPERATMGGVIAANLSGPTRFSQGTVRDFLIGLRAVRADGTMIKGGGRVVKNVAGYDIPKLFCGSFGTLGVIVEATFKVRPRPEKNSLLVCSFSSAEQAMDLALRVAGSELQPFFLELTNFAPSDDLQNGDTSYFLFVGFAGLSEEIQYQQQRLHDLLGAAGTVIAECENEQAQGLFQPLRDFSAAGEALLQCRLSLLPTSIAPFGKEIEAEAAARGFAARLLAHAGNGVIYGRFLNSHGAPPEKILSFVDWLRIQAKKQGGYLVIENIDSALKERVDVWGHIGGAFSLMKRLKETLDPNDILNPGRFVGGI